MQLLKLSLQNINSFREKVQIDFESAPLNEASLLAITGATGAGKTTLFDSLCVALYNRTPRLSSIGNQNPGNLLSQGRTEGFAEVLFDADDVRYRSEWRIKRNQRGELRAEAKLININKNELITDRLSRRSKSRGTSELTVNEAVSEILGLDFDAFTRSVMLAQGDFAAFLKANEEARSLILEATTGLKIYDELKKMLNEKVNESKNGHQQVEAVFKAIPEASREEIDATRIQLAQLKADATSLQERRQTILSAKAQETNRTRLHEQLVQVQAHDNELLERQSEIEMMKSERECAHRAAKRIPEYQRFQSEKAEFERAALAFDNAQNQYVQVQEEYEKSSAEYAEVDALYQAALDERETLMPVYNTARTDEIMAQTRFEALNDLRGNLKTVETQIFEVSNQFAAQKVEKSVLAQQLDADSDFLRAHSLPDNSGEQLSDARVILERRNSKYSLLIGRSKTLEASQSKQTQLTNQLTQLQQAHAELLDEEATAETTLEEAETELHTQQKRGTLESWKERKRQAQQMQPIALTYEQVIRRLTEIQSELERMIGSQKDVRAKLTALQAESALQIEIIGQSAERVKRHQAERDSVMLENQVIPLRHRLEEGEPCPVCGSVEHPWAGEAEHQGENQLELASQDLSQAEEVWKSVQKDFDKLEQQRVRLEGNVENFDTQISQSQKQIESLHSTIQTAQAQWDKVYPKTEIAVINLQMELDAVEESHNILHESMMTHVKTLNNQKLLIERRANHEREMLRLQADYQAADADHQVLIAEIKTLRCEIDAIDAQFWERLPEAFRGDEPKSAIDKFAEQIDAVKACEERVNQKQHQFERLTDRVNETATNLEADVSRRSKIAAEVEQYQSEGDKWLASAREKTGDTSVEEATQKLEMAVKDRTKHRNDVAATVREKEQALTQSWTHRDDAEFRQTEAREKLDAAQIAYLTSLTVEGFTGPDSHEQAFRDDAWLENCTNEIDQYQQEREMASQKIETLRNHFTDAPFDPAAMGRILHDEREIDQRLQVTNQEHGRLQQRMGQLEENLRRRDERLQALEKAKQERDRWAALHECIGGNTFRRFALRWMFDLILQFANQQLEYLTKRYQLKAKGQLDMAVIDRWNANAERPVETLSGGESFLTSLALALALSEMNRGRTQPNSLFLDEGFGTLDTQTLDIAISALEGLRLRGRNICVISHVEELTRRIPVRIAVEKMGNGSSRVRVRG